MDAAKAPQKLGLSGAEAMGKPLLFNYGSLSNGTEYLMEVILYPDSIYWRDLWEGGAEETDPSKTILLSPDRVLITFKEENGSSFAVYVDYMSGETSYSGRSGANDRGDFDCFYRTGYVAPKP